jgi:hypothetical protein
VTAPGRKPSLAWFAAIAALLVALHLPFLRLPYHWDELGQFVPASLDLFREGAWVPRSTLPNVHPPGLMALVAGVWKVAGESILASRLAMLMVASAGVFAWLLLAIRLGGRDGVWLLALAPVFYTQSMMVQLDMPAMTLTGVALYLFLEGRYAWSAAASVALVLVKETSITTPLVFAAWLWLHEGRRREAAYFLAPAVAFGAWLLALQRATGHWLGNAGFARENLGAAAAPLHVAGAAVRNLWALLVADGRFLGSWALLGRWKLLQNRDWAVAWWVGGAQLGVVTLFGGAMLERYLLPVMPLVFIAMGAVLRTWQKAAMAVLLVAGWFWSTPYPSQRENLSMVDFVHLQQDAARYLEVQAPGRRVASMWPFTDAIRRPEFGYVSAPLRAVDLPGLDAASIAAADRSSYDLLVVYARRWPPPAMRFIAVFARRYLGYLPEASAEEILEKTGLRPRMQWTRGAQWIVVYGL